MSAHIVGFEQSSLFLYHIDSLSMVFHIQPVTDVLTVTVDRKLFAMQCIIDDQRDQLLRELERTVIVGAVGNVGREMIGIHMVQEQGRLFETYNVGGHNEKQNIEIINIIIETLQEMLPDSDPRKAHINNDLITYVEDRKGHDRRYAIAPDKIKAEIGWFPETMFKEGIRKTIAWYFEHEDWMNNVTSGDYQKYYNEMYEEK